jgi:hypothetical protein
MPNDIIDNQLPDFDDFQIDLPIVEDVIPTEDPIVIPDDEPIELPVEDDEIEIPEERDEEAVATFKSLVDKGVFPDDEEFQGTWGEIETKMEQLPSLVAQSLIANSPEPFQKVVQYAYLKPDITNEDLAEFLKTLIEETTPVEIDYEDIDSLKEFLTTSYKAQGLSAKAANAAVKSLEDEDFEGEAIKEEAKKFYETQNKTSKTDAIIAQQEEDNNTRIANQQIFINKVADELTATGWADSRVNLISNQLKENKVTTIIQKAFQSPKALIQLANLTTYYNEKTESFEFNDFVKQVATKEVEKTKSNIVRDNMRNVGGGGSVNIKNQPTNNLKFEPLLD